MFSVFCLFIIFFFGGGSLEVEARVLDALSHGNGFGALLLGRLQLFIGSSIGRRTLFQIQLPKQGCPWLPTATVLASASPSHIKIDRVLPGARPRESSVQVKRIPRRSSEVCYSFNLLLGGDCGNGKHAEKASRQKPRKVEKRTAVRSC